MLAEWFKPADPQAKPAAAGGESKSAVHSEEDKRKEHSRKLREQEPVIAKELTAEELSAQREATLRRKLAAAANGSGGQAGPGNSATFESIMRPLNRLLMTEQHNEFFDGIQMQTSRQMHNLMVQSKLSVGSPQTAGWELVLQANGFSDVSSVTYSTAGRTSLMHQRMFKSGALGVGQFMAQNTPMGPQGNFYGMLQYPWMRNGASSISYLKGQNVTLSHGVRVLRGLTVGANMAYDMTTKTTSMTYAGSLNRKNVSWYGSWTPDKGEWKLATTRQDWELDTEMFAMVEMANRKGQSGGEDLMSMVSFGLKKPFIGGATVSAVLQGFARLKGVLELPFGGDREGFNRVTLTYCVQYDAIKGACKQGIGLSL